MLLCVIDPAAHAQDIKAPVLNANPVSIDKNRTGKYDVGRRRTYRAKLVANMTHA
jgi:hypothetical protein